MCVNSPTPTPTTNKFQRLREGSFCVNVQRLFNGLPSDLTGVTQIDFKNELDRFLWTVADKPLVSTQFSRIYSSYPLERSSFKIILLVMEKNVLCAEKNIIVVCV